MTTSEQPYSTESPGPWVIFTVLLFSVVVIENRSVLGFKPDFYGNATSYLWSQIAWNLARSCVMCISLRLEHSVSVPASRQKPSGSQLICQSLVLQAMGSVSWSCKSYNTDYVLYRSVKWTNHQSTSKRTTSYSKTVLTFVENTLKQVNQRAKRFAQTTFDKEIVALDEVKNFSTVDPRNSA